MTLQELFNAVKEKRLTKDQLEDYRDQLSGLFADMQLEIAELEKLEALYSQDFDSAVARKNSWKATKEGQRLIELKRFCTGTKEILNSLKSRLYSIY